MSAKRAFWMRAGCVVALWPCLVAACRPPVTAPPPPRAGGACEDLAFVFFLVAEKRDRGSTREEQEQALRDGMLDPFAVHPDRTLRDLLRVVDLVYRRPDADARTLQSIVRDQCVVDANGEPLLRSAWPRTRPRASR